MAMPPPYPPPRAGEGSIVEFVPDLPPWFFEPKGRYDEHRFESQVLKENPLGDPYRRPLWVYVPPGYDADSQRRYPSIYVIMGLTGQIDMWRNPASMRRNFPELADAQFAAGGAPPCILVYVVPWTSAGGSPYGDSPGTGKYHTYLCDELVPWVDARYRTLPQARHRGIAGKSSGGYGAMISPCCVRICSAGWRPTLATRSSRCPMRRRFPGRFARSATTITAPSTSSGRNSAAEPRSPGRATATSSTIGAWRPATRRTTTAPSACPTRPRPAS